MNFSKKNRERLVVNTFFISKKIRIISYLILLISISSCTDDEMPAEEREQPQTIQQISQSEEN